MSKRAERLCLLLAALGSICLALAAYDVLGWLGVKLFVGLASWAAVLIGTGARRWLYPIHLDRPGKADPKTGDVEYLDKWSGILWQGWATYEKLDKERNE